MRIRMTSKEAALICEALVREKEFVITELKDREVLKGEVFQIRYRAEHNPFILLQEKYLEKKAILDSKGSMAEVLRLSQRVDELGLLLRKFEIIRVGAKRKGRYPRYVRPELYA